LGAAAGAKKAAFSGASSAGMMIDGFDKCENLLLSRSCVPEISGKAG